MIIDRSQFITEESTGLVFYKRKQDGVIQDVKVLDYISALDYVLQDVELRIQNVEYSNSSIKEILLGHVLIIKDILKEKDLTRNKGALIRMIWDLHRPESGLGREMNFVLSFFMRFDVVENEENAS